MGEYILQKTQARPSGLANITINVAQKCVAMNILTECCEYMLGTALFSVCSSNTMSQLGFYLILSQLYLHKAKLK